MDRKTLFTISKFAVSVVGLIYTVYYAPKSASKGICPEGTVLTSDMLSKESFMRPQVLYGECFFPANYDDGSERFFDIAQEAGADVFSIPVRREDGLKNSVAIFRQGADPKKFLVHISGTHGPEGYVGSAIQIAALHYIKKHNIYAKHRQEEAALIDSNAAVVVDNSGTILAEDIAIPTDKSWSELSAATSANTSSASSLPPTLVFVYALNPYGFKYHRRVNENNVDLNRNFLSQEEWSYVKSLDPDYARHIELQHVINPTSRPFSVLMLNELYTLALSGYYVLKYGVNTIKTALVAGNYINPAGYSYGGVEYTQSTKNLMHLLIEMLDIPHQAERFVLIDVHSGLGPSGVDTLLDMGAKEGHNTGGTHASDAEVYERVFPTEYDAKGNVIGALKAGSNAAEVVSKGYELTKGGVTSTFCNEMMAPHLSGENKLCVTQVNRIILFRSSFSILNYNNIFISVNFVVKQEFGTLDTTTVGMVRLPASAHIFQ